MKRGETVQKTPRKTGRGTAERVSGTLRKFSQPAGQLVEAFAIDEQDGHATTGSLGARRPRVARLRDHRRQPAAGGTSSRAPRTGMVSYARSSICYW